MEHKKTRCCKSELAASWKKIFEREPDQVKRDNQHYVTHSSAIVNYLFGISVGIITAVIGCIIAHLVM